MGPIQGGESTLWVSMWVWTEFGRLRGKGGPIRAWIGWRARWDSNPGHED
jgi:hypothetical protein